MVPNADQRALRDAGRLVGALEFQQVIDINRAFPRCIRIGPAHNDTGRIDLVNDPIMLGNDGNTGVFRHTRFHPGPDQRGDGLQKRHSLTLHV